MTEPWIVVFSHCLLRLEIWLQISPLDPDVSGALTVSKSAASSEVSVGGFMTYTVKIHNRSDQRENFSDANTFDSKLYNVRLNDTLPYGFRYVSGTAFLDGKNIADPEGAPGPNLTFLNLY